jgi:hypothetical protein
MTKPYVKTSHMSNQQKAEFVYDIFYIQSFWGGNEFCQKPDLYRKVKSAQISLFS